MQYYLVLIDEGAKLSNPADLDSPSQQSGKSPTLSVVVLTFNSAATIERCLDSLADQQFDDFETVIVDDNSTDATVALAKSYEGRLRLTVVLNGSRNIPKGRNIGLNHHPTEIIAFLDSDDVATSQWTQVIIDTFKTQPELALISGRLIPSYRTKRAQAIATNDAMVHRVAGRGIMQFRAGNCAVNRRLLPGDVFNEHFLAGEDLELASRVQRNFRCSFIEAMQIHHNSRDSFHRYSKQMYRYGCWKIYLGYKERSYRWIDFVPLGLMLISIGVAATFGPWWLFLSIIPFSLLEAIVVVASNRCTLDVAVLTFPAWVTKNISWSIGVGYAILSLVAHPQLRQQLRSNRIAQ